MNISQQASAVEAATRIISGAAVKPSAKEREYIIAAMREAAVTLRKIERSA